MARMLGRCEAAPMQGKMGDWRLQVCAADAAGAGLVAMAVVAAGAGLLPAPGRQRAALRRAQHACGAALRHEADRPAHGLRRAGRQLPGPAHHGALCRPRLDCLLTFLAAASCPLQEPLDHVKGSSPFSRQPMWEALIKEAHTGSARCCKEANGGLSAPAEAGGLVMNSLVLRRLHAQWSLPARAAYLGWLSRFWQMQPSTST